MIKFWRNREKVAFEQEERVWNHIDSLYARLEQGLATDEELKQIDEISKIIMDVTTDKGKKEVVAQDELNVLSRRNYEMLAEAIGIKMVEGGEGRSMGQVKKEQKLRLVTGIRYLRVGIAASVLFVLGLSLYVNQMVTDHTKAMAYNVIRCWNDSVLHLADGSMVYLAAGSELSVTNNFGKKDRRVKLVGEAFFEVAKDKNKSFIVKTKDMDAIVHGTSFNVIAYSGIVESQIAVCTGCVEVAVGEQSFGRFHSGDRVVYDDVLKKAIHNKIDPAHIKAWITGGFILEDASVEELKYRVKHYFHRELVIEKDAIPLDARINYCSYKVEQSELNVVMKNICAIYGIRYKITDNQILITR